MQARRRRPVRYRQGHGDVSCPRVTTPPGLSGAPPSIRRTASPSSWLARGSSTRSVLAAISRRVADDTIGRGDHGHACRSRARSSDRPGSSSASSRPRRRRGRGEGTARRSTRRTATSRRRSPCSRSSWGRPARRGLLLLARRARRPSRRARRRGLRQPGSRPCGSGGRRARRSFGASASSWRRCSRRSCSARRRSCHHRRRGRPLCSLLVGRDACCGRRRSRSRSCATRFATATAGTTARVNAFLVRRRRRARPPPDVDRAGLGAAAGRLRRSLDRPPRAAPRAVVTRRRSGPALAAVVLAGIALAAYAAALRVEPREAPDRLLYEWLFVARASRSSRSRRRSPGSRSDPASFAAGSRASRSISSGRPRRAGSDVLARALGDPGAAAGVSGRAR